MGSGTDAHKRAIPQIALKSLRTNFVLQFAVAAFAMILALAMITSVTLSARPAYHLGLLALYGGLVAVMWGATRAVRRHEVMLEAKNIELQTLNAELRKARERSQQRLLLLLDSAGEGFFGLDTEGRITFVNPAAARMTGYPEEEIIGNLEHDVLHHSHYCDSKDGTPCAIQATLADGTAHQVDTEQFWSKDGTSFPVEYICNPVHEQGEIVGVVVTFQDVTQKRELDRRRDTFVSVASHELRTPMTTIMGFTELLLQMDPGPELRSEWLNRVYRESQRLASIVNDFFDVSRVNSGKLELKLENLSIGSVLRDVVADLETVSERHEVIIDGALDTPEVLADRDKLAQILVNLLDNAIKYSPNGGHVSAFVTHEPVQRRVVVSITDQGIGIGIGDRDRLFSTFQRIRRPETEGIRGTGLGLYIVKGLVGLMDGEVWIESELNRGTKFSFSLPTAEKVSA